MAFYSVTLKNIIQRNFPEEYAERRLENDSLTNPGVDLLPLFVMDVILPCQKFQLNIFEPRYRLMVSWSNWHGKIYLRKKLWCTFQKLPYVEMCIQSPWDWRWHLIFRRSRSMIAEWCSNYFVQFTYEDIIKFCIGHLFKFAVHASLPVTSFGNWGLLSLYGILSLWRN